LLDDPRVVARDESGPRYASRKALTRAGLRSIRFRDLRHTFGTHCAFAGVPLRALQEWLGHRDFTTTLIYADYAPNPHEAELIEQAFRSPDPTAASARLS
jgi:integrase